MIRIMFFLLGALMIVPQDLFAQFHWGFDDRSNVLISNAGRRCQYHTDRQLMELVPGIEGQAIRTDGYSTYVSYMSREDVKSVSGYFALESLPTDSASFITVLDMQGNSIAASVNAYGNLFLEVIDGVNYSVISSSDVIKPFTWYHISLDLKDGKVELNLNGKNSVKAASNMVGRRVFYGKGPKPKFIGLYDVTFINGIMDELSVNETLPLQDEMKILLNQRPKLAVPSERFVLDFNRPKYHLIPAANWTNETHGLIYYKGQYHIFNQKNASNINLRKINWGHFSSPDLLYWTEQKPILAPEPGYDPDGIWSGCAVINDKGVPQIFYTAGSSETGVGTAFPKDDMLIEWDKYIANPIIAEKPERFTRHDMRDQYVWKEKDGWHMIIGFGIEGEEPHGTLLHYRSSDLINWEYVNLLYEGKPKIDKTGIFWEMPVFMKMGNKYVLSVNRVPNRGIPARTQYWVGKFERGKFVPDNEIPENLEVINRLLSPSVWQTSSNTAVAIGIIPDEIYGEQNYRQGWAHLFSMPRVWTLKDGKICQSPHEVMKSLRKDSVCFDSKEFLSRQLSSGSHQVELELQFTYQDNESFGLTICKDEDGKEYTKIIFDPSRQMLVVDQTHSSLLPYVPNAVREDVYEMPKSGVLKLNLFIDGSVVEGFINGKDAFTTRIFTALENSTLIEWEGNAEKVHVSGNVYQLDSALVQTNF